VEVGNFLELQGSLLGSGQIYSLSNKKVVVYIEEAISLTFNLFLSIQDFFNFLGYKLELFFKSFNVSALSFASSKARRKSTVS